MVAVDRRPKTIANLEPAHVEKKLEDGEEGKTELVFVKRRSVVNFSPSDYAGEKEHVDGKRDNLAKPMYTLC